MRECLSPKPSYQNPSVNSWPMPSSQRPDVQYVKAVYMEPSIFLDSEIRFSSKTCMLSLNDIMPQYCSCTRSPVA